VCVCARARVCVRVCIFVQGEYGLRMDGRSQLDNVVNGLQYHCSAWEREGNRTDTVQ